MCKHRKVSCNFVTVGRATAGERARCCRVVINWHLENIRRNHLGQELVTTVPDFPFLSQKVDNPPVAQASRKPSRAKADKNAGDPTDVESDGEALKKAPTKKSARKGKKKTGHTTDGESDGEGLKPRRSSRVQAKLTGGLTSGNATEPEVNSGDEDEEPPKKKQRPFHGRPKESVGVPPSRKKSEAGTVKGKQREGIRTKGA